jgi:hypothetical protein
MTTMEPGRVRHPSTWKTGLIATCIMYGQIGMLWWASALARIWYIQACNPEL